jgi:hypothetical protein
LKPNIWQIIKSVAASAIGVQSQANYEQDSKSNSFVPYLIVGVIFVLLFIASLIAWVNAMLG